MSDLSRPSSRVATRTGLAKIRNLNTQDVEIKAPVKAQEMPNGWYYNQNQEKEFWNDLEKIDKNYEGNNEDDAEKQEACFNDLSAAANRIHQLISQFESIDQETAMELSNIYDDESGVADLDKGEIMSEAKNAVVLNIDELDDISKSQETLIRSLRNWFDDQNHIKIDEPQEQIPDVQSTFDYLNNCLKEYTDKSEKASFLHNDVTEFWTKRVVNMKKLICSRDEEIQHLKESIDQMQAIKTRKAKKKENEAKENQVLKEKEKQIEAQMRMIAEQKNQIQNLKGSLRNAEVAQIASSLTQQVAPVTVNDEAALKEENDRAVAALANEQAIALQKEKIQNLMDQIEKIRNELKEQRSKNDSLTQKISKKDTEINEKDILVQKYIKLAEIEKEKNVKAMPKRTIRTDNDSYVHMLETQKKINKLNEEHRQELRNQADIMNENFQKEKMALLSAMQAPDSQQLLSTLLKENDLKLEKLKEEYKNDIEKLEKNNQSKISILTRQYEHRIRNMNADHEDEIITLKKDQEYQVKCATLELESQEQERLLEFANSKKEKIEELEKRINELEDKNFLYQRQNEMFRTTIERLDPESDVLNETVIGTDKMHNAPDFTQDKILKKAIDKSRTIKEELQEQHKWEIQTLKKAYEGELERKKYDVQIAARDALMNVQAKIDESDAKCDPAYIQDTIADAIIVLNDQINTKKPKDDDYGDEKLTANEAFIRTNQLTEKISLLTTENNELKDQIEEMKEQTGGIMEKYEKLRVKNEFFESTQSDDQKLMAAKLEQIQKEFADEIAYKDQVIKELQNIMLLEKSHDYVMYTIPVFDMYVEVEDDGEFTEISEVETIANKANEEEEKAEEEINEINEEPQQSSNEQEKEEIIKEPETKQVTVEKEPEIKQVTVEKESEVKPVVKEEPVVKEVEKQEEIKQEVETKPVVVEREPEVKQVVEEKQDSSRPPTPQKKPPKIPKPESSVRIEHSKERVSARSVDLSTEDEEQKKSEENLINTTESTDDAVSEDSMQTTRSLSKESISRNSSDEVFNKVLTKNNQNSKATRSLKKFDSGMVGSFRKRSNTQRIAKVYVTAASQTNNEDEYESELPPPPELHYESGDSFSINGGKAEFKLNIVPERLLSPKPRIRQKRIKRLKFSPMIILNRANNFVENAPQKAVGTTISRPFANSKYLMYTHTNVDLDPFIRTTEEVQVDDPVPDKLREKINELRDELISQQKQVKAMIESLDEQKEREKCLKIMADSEKAANEELMRKEEELMEKEKQALLEAENAKRQLENMQQYPTEITIKIEGGDDDSKPIVPQKTAQHVQSPIYLDKSIPKIDLTKKDKTQIFNVPQPNSTPPPIPTNNETSIAPSPLNINRAPEKIQQKNEGSRSASVRSIPPQYHLLFEPIQKEEIPDPKKSEDPFNDSLSLIARAIRVCMQTKKDQEKINDVLNSDTRGYESYLQATGTVEHNTETFFNDIHNVTYNIGVLSNSFDYEISIHNALITLLHHSQKKHKVLLKQMSELKERTENSKLDESKKMLEEISASKHMEKSVVLSKIEATLLTLNNLGIDLSPKDLLTYESLSKKCQQFKSNSNTERQLIDNLLAETQEFIINVKNANIKGAELMTISSMTELKNVKKALAKAENQIIRLKDDIQHQKDICETHEQEKVVLRQRIDKEKKEYAEQISVYQAQIGTLNELFGKISGTNETQNNDGNIQTMTQKIKAQIISLQALLDTTMADKAAAEARAFDLEELSNKKEREIMELKKELENCRITQNELETKVTQYRHNALFHETDSKKLKEESTESNNVKKQTDKELQTMQETISTLKRQIIELEKEKTFLKQSVANLETDTESDKIEREIYELLKATDNKNMSCQRNLEKISTHPTPLTLSDEDIPVKDVCDKQASDEDLSIEEEEVAEELNDSNKVKLTSRSQVVFNSRNILPVPKQITELPQRQKLKPLPSKGFSSSRNGSRPPSAITAGALIIPKVGSSQRLGARASSRSCALNNPAALSDLPPIQSTHFNISKPQQQQQIPCSRPKTAVSAEEYLPGNLDTETIRITNINFPQQAQKRSAPMVAPIQTEIPSTDPFTIKGSTKVYTQDFNAQDFLKSFTKLKAKLKEIIEASEKKDDLITELKSKLVESSIQLQQTRIEILRAKEETRKSNIKAADLSQRLDIALDEIAKMTQDASDLRMQVYKYKAYIGPIDSSIEKYNKAHQQKQIVTRARNFENDAIQQTRKSLAKAKNDATKNHLLTMLENHRESKARYEAKRRMWEEQEKKQITKALEAMFLIDTSDPLDSIILPFTGTFVSKPRKVPEPFLNADDDESDFGGNNIERIDLSISGKPN